MRRSCRPRRGSLSLGTVLTSLTAVLREAGHGDSAGLVYGVMGVGSTILALSTSLFPQRFSLRARLLVFGALMLAAMAAFGLAAASLPMMVAAMAVAGIGVGPTVVTLYSLAAERSPQGRSATVANALLGAERAPAPAPQELAEAPAAHV